MNEKIIDIEFEKEKDSSSYNYIGYIIETEKQTINILIENFQSCCENFGYIAYDSEFNEIYLFEKIFINENLSSIEWVYNYNHIINLNDNDNDFNLKLNTDNSIIIKVVINDDTYYLGIYNEHNGYYHKGYTISWKNFNNNGFI